jgi:hypothetical protein
MMTLMQNLTRQIRDDINLLVNNKQINSILVSAEKILGFQRKQIIYCNVDLLDFFLSLFSFSWF